MRTEKLELYLNSVDKFMISCLFEYLSKDGIKLTFIQKTIIRRKYLKNKKLDLKFYWFNTIFRKNNESIELYLEGFEQYLEGYFGSSDELLNAMDAYTESKAKILLKEYLATNRSNVVAQRKSKAINREVRRLFSKEIEALWSLITMTESLFLSATKHFEEFENSKKEALTLLLSQACLVSSEILCLIENGYADAAMARWRTIHEIAVIFMFLSEKDDETSLMFLEHASVSTYKELNEYVLRSDFLGFEKPTVNEIQRVTENYNGIVEKYSNNFRSEYGWACKHFPKNKERIGFIDIEKLANQDYLRSYYKLASNAVHANSKGLSFKLGKEVNDPYLLGSSSKGLFDPIQLTAIDLNKILVTVLLPGNDIMDTVTAKVSLLLVNRICGRI